MPRRRGRAFPRPCSHRSTALRGESRRVAARHGKLSCRGATRLVARRWQFLSEHEPCSGATWRFPRLRIVTSKTRQRIPARAVFARRAHFSSSAMIGFDESRANGFRQSQMALILEAALSSPYGALSAPITSLSLVLEAWSGSQNGTYVATSLAYAASLPRCLCPSDSEPNNRQVAQMSTFIVGRDAPRA
jgi:hypothetical protein